MDKQFDERTTTDVGRRDLLVRALTGAAFGAGALIVPKLASAGGGGSEGAKDAEIHELQANFHLAKSTQDIDLMMSLWADDAVVAFNGNTYIGTDAIRALLLTTGSFTHLRLSLVTSFKIQIHVKGNEAYLYFECIDIGNFDQPSRFIAGALYNAGTVRKIDGDWLFWRMNFGLIPTLSVDHYAYP